MKAKEELNVLTEEINSLNAKLAELTEEELEQVAGGVRPSNGVVLIKAMPCGVMPGLVMADLMGKPLDTEKLG